jgi:hypothetical protein
MPDVSLQFEPKRTSAWSVKEACNSIPVKVVMRTSTLARYDERRLAMTTRLNLMDKRWDELRQDLADVCRVG